MSRHASTTCRFAPVAGARCCVALALYCPGADLSACLPADALGKAEARTVVPVVQSTAAPDEFPGLYCGSLAQDAFLGEPVALAVSLPFPAPAVIWTRPQPQPPGRLCCGLQHRVCMPRRPHLDSGLPAADNNTLLVTTQWRSATALAAVDLTSGRVQRLGDVSTEASSWCFAGQSAGELPDLDSTGVLLQRQTANLKPLCICAPGCNGCSCCKGPALSNSPKAPYGALHECANS